MEITTIYFDKDEDLFKNKSGLQNLIPKSIYFEKNDLIIFKDLKEYRYINFLTFLKNYYKFEDFSILNICSFFNLKNAYDIEGFNKIYDKMTQIENMKTL